MRPLIGQEPGPGGEHPILPSDRDRGQRLALVAVGVKLVEAAARLLFQHHRCPLAHIDRGIDPGLQGHACGEVKGSGVVDGDPVVDTIEGEGLAEASLGDPGGAADGACVALTRGIDDGRAARFLKVVRPDELGVVPTPASRGGDRDVSALGLGVGAAWAICRQADRVGACGRVGVDGVSRGARAAVPEAPGPSGYAAGRIIGEGHGQGGGARAGRGGEARDRDCSRRRNGLRGGVASCRARDGQGDGVSAGVGVGFRGARRGARRAVAEVQGAARDVAGRGVGEGDRQGATPELGPAVKLATGAAVAGAVVALTSFENPLQVVLPLLYALAAK